MSRLSVTVSALALIGTLVSIPAEANPRAFVASDGSDANTASSCGLLSACRTFAAALTVVDVGGEIVALDAGGYGPVTITKSVTITANPGFYAGIIAPATGHAVTIDTAGVNVILRGLAITKSPAVSNISGVAMLNGASLSIENCVISNFLSGAGVGVSTPALVRIVDSLFRSNNAGVALSGGATATISGSKIVGDPCCGSTGVAVAGTASTTTTAAISDTVMANSNNYAVFVEAFTATAVARASVTRSTLSNGGYGAYVTAQSGGTAVLTVSNSMVTGNSATGLAQVGTGTLRSLVNNTVDQNGTNASGTITYLPPM